MSGELASYFRPVIGQFQSSVAAAAAADCIVCICATERYAHSDRRTNGQRDGPRRRQHLAGDASIAATLSIWSSMCRAAVAMFRDIKKWETSLHYQTKSHQVCSRTLQHKRWHEYNKLLTATNWSQYKVWDRTSKLKCCICTNNNNCL